MTDLSLLLAGCVVAFVAAAGAYVYIGGAFERGSRTETRPAREEGARDRLPGARVRRAT